MPPEALTVVEAPYGTSLDSFSFGVTTLAVLTGHQPDRSLGTSAVERKVDGVTQVIPECERRAIDLQRLEAGHPLRQLILRCLDNDPERRPQVSEILQELDEYIGWLTRQNESEQQRHDLSARKRGCSGMKEPMCL